MASKVKPPVALIAGPTASGKSALGLALAERTSGIIVNADSAQVYRDLPVLNAAPSEQELARAEHRLYGYRDGSEACSAANWAERARTEIRNILAQQRLPILVGGTGLYLRTLLEGIAPVPEIDDQIRRRVRATPVDENLIKLRWLDPESANKLEPADKTRIARALEVVVSTGRTLKDWQKERKGGIGDEIELRPVILLPPREWLYERCNERFAQMMTQGAIEQVEVLLARELNPNLPIMRTIGVREIAAYLAEQSSLAEAIAAGQQATRRYAKRQYTWFAHQPPAAWPRFHEALNGASMARALELL